MSKALNGIALIAILLCVGMIIAWLLGWYTIYDPDNKTWDFLSTSRSVLQYYWFELPWRYPTGVTLIAPGLWVKNFVGSRRPSPRL
jgi:hypothetical protein